MANRKSIDIKIWRYFLPIRSCINNLVPLRVRGTSLLTCSYIGETRNDRKFKRENKPFIVFILTLRRVLF